MQVAVVGIHVAPAGVAPTRIPALPGQTAGLQSSRCQLPIPFVAPIGTVILRDADRISAHSSVSAGS
eukprot:COSAG02_NODE_38674_length_426_cov_0.938838_1_plen_66_part_10